LKNIRLFVGLTEDFSLCRPLEIKRNPSTLSEAQMSLPYSVALAAVGGKPRLKHFLREGYTNAEILRISKKVDFEVYQEYGSQMCTPVVKAAVEVKLTDGRVLREDRKGIRHGNPKNR